LKRYISEMKDDPAKYLADTERIMKNLAQVGATVFVRYRPGYGAGDGFEENQVQLAPDTVKIDQIILDADLQP